MQRFLAVSFFIFLIPALLAARVPVFVDITSAENEISQRQQANDAAAGQSGDLESQIESLEQDNQAQRDKIAQARELISDLSVSRGELYAARNRTNDLEQKKRVVEQLTKNMAQDFELQGMIEKFTKKIEDNNILIEAHRKQIARNNLSIRENEEEIDYLRQCVTMTEGNENSLDDIISRQNSNSSAFDSFVSANQ